MSISRALLFWSKSDKKSIRMKKIAEDLGTDIDTISVDSAQVREMLLEDEHYGIDQVPAVLIIYTNGQHKSFTGSSLDKWFEELIENIKNYQTQSTQLLPPQPEYTPIGVISDENIPKELRRSIPHTSEIVTSLPPPGRPLPEMEESPIQGAIAREHIRSGDSQSARAIKKDGISPAELAKRMAEERKNIDDAEEQKRGI